MEVEEVADKDELVRLAGGIDAKVAVLVVVVPETELELCGFLRPLVCAP